MKESRQNYRRTPLPAGAQPKLGWILLCLACLLASPFIGFAIDGKVAEPGFVIGLAISALPLAGLAILAVMHWSAMRRLPPALADEWRTGRVIRADGAPAMSPPVRFSHENHLLEIQAQGLVLSKSLLLGLRGTEDAAGKMWIAQTVGDLFVPWSDIKEWEVHTDSDGPDFYRLILHAKGSILIRRFRPNAGSEADLLDAVRSVGKIPIRLLCDLDDP